MAPCRTKHTVYPKKYAHGFAVLCFVVVMQSFIMNSHEVFIHIHQDCFAGTGAIVRLPQRQWSKPDGYGKISQCISTTKHSKAKTVCIFLGIYCTLCGIQFGHSLTVLLCCDDDVISDRIHATYISEVIVTLMQPSVALSICYFILTNDCIIDMPLWYIGGEFSIDLLPLFISLYITQFKHSIFLIFSLP